MSIRKKIISLWSLAAEKNYLNWLPDKWFLSINYRLNLGKKLNLDKPTRFNEKLQWLKLYYRMPLMTTLVDKYLVREYVASTIGEQYLIPLLGVWNTAEEIDFDKLPSQFVLKCNHDSGGVLRCKDKQTFDLCRAKSFLDKQQKVNFYWKGREWPYKNVKKKIIAEQFMVDESGYELKDYKFFCFSGKVHFFKVDFDRFVEHHANYYDRNLALMPFGEADYPSKEDKKIIFPTNIDEMFSLAEQLSKGFPFVRVDLYNINGHIYFGEMTFFPAGGKRPFDPDEWDYTLGKWIDLPEKKVES